jgi:glycosyltransferase involved in cell wall biosynthesis
MRILHVVPTYYPAVRYGGPIRSVHGLAVGLAQRGHDVHVYTTSVDGAEDLDVPLGQPVNMDGVSVHYFKVPALRRLYWTPSMQAALRKNAATFDVIHLHSVFLWPMWVAARVAARSGVPYVMSPRGMLMRDAIRQKSQLLKFLWINLIERESLAKAAAIHVTADLEGEELLALDLNGPKIVQIPNGVERPHPGTPSHRSFAHLPDPFALFLSRIDPKKGLDRLIRSWRHVPDLDLVIAGNDEEGYQSRLEDMVDAERVSDRVHFIGPVDDQSKWELYARAELFILPSYAENFGNVVAEAMMMSCPVIVTPEVGIAAIVGEAAAGIIVSNDPPKLARAVLDLHEDSGKRREMGLNGHRAAVEKLSWGSVARDMESMYVGFGTRIPSHAPTPGVQ